MRKDIFFILNLLLFGFSAFALADAEHVEAFARCRKALLAMGGDPLVVAVYEELHNDPHDQNRRDRLLQNAADANYLLGVEGVVYGQLGELRIIGRDSRSVSAGTVESGILGLERDAEFNLTSAVTNSIVIAEDIGRLKIQIAKKMPMSIVLETAKEYFNTQSMFAAKILNSPEGQASWKKMRQTTSLLHPATEGIAREIDLALANVDELGHGDFSKIHPGEGSWKDPRAVIEISRTFALAVIADMRAKHRDPKMDDRLNVAIQALDDPQGAGADFLHSTALRLRSNAFAINAAKIIEAASGEGKEVKLIMGEAHGPQVDEILLDELGDLISLRKARSNSPDADPFRDSKQVEWNKIQLLKTQIAGAQSEEVRRTGSYQIQLAQVRVGYMETMQRVLPNAEAIIGKPRTMQHGKEIMRACGIGVGEIGADGVTPARLGNYTDQQRQLQEQSLIKAGLSPKETQDLIKANLIGAKVEQLFDPK